MGKLRCIDERDVVEAVRLAVESGSATLLDNYGNEVRYSTEFDLFNIHKEGSYSHLDIGTLGELLRLSVTADICKIKCYDRTLKKDVMLKWWDIIIVNNPRHGLYGAMISAADGHIIIGADERVRMEGQL